MERRETAGEIDDAAMTWVARLDRAESSTVVEAELQVWLDGDPRRQGAFLRARALWSKLDCVSPAHQVSTLASRGMVRAPRRVTSVRWTRRAAIGSGAALAAGLAGALMFDRPDQTIDTRLGEVRHMPLADGSTVDLNTQSRILVSMRPRLRRIRLTEGEAWFQVRKDSQRPFVVEAGDVRVRAVGTAFSVRMLENGVQVCVTEGVVEAWVAGKPAPPVRIAAGEAALINQAAQIVRSVTAASEIDRKLAWRVGKIDLAGETLADAIAEFNRYNAVQLRLSNAALADKRFYGVFRINDAAGFAEAVHVSLDTPVTASDDYINIG